MKSTILLAAASFAACGKSSASPSAAPTTASGAPASSPGAPPPASGPQDRCEVRVTGDVTFSFAGSHPRGERGLAAGKIGATTDYWMSDGEIRMGLAALAGFSKKSQHDIADEVDAEMKRDPRFMLLLVNCSVEGQGFFNVSPANGSRYEDVPFKPGRYALVTNQDVKPGEFRVMLSIQPGGKHEGFSVSEPGTIELTRFDETGIAGTFSFNAKSYAGKAVAVTGSFDYGCLGGAHCRR
jgi:hypothetical protein